METKLQVGVISSTHGVRGEVKVFPTTDDVKRFKRLKEVILNTGKEEITLEIEGVKFFKQFVILKFKGYDNINDIEKYKGKSLLVTRANAVRLRRDEYFIADLQTIVLPSLITMTFTTTKSNPLIFPKRILFLNLSANTNPFSLSRTPKYSFRNVNSIILTCCTMKYTPPIQDTNFTFSSASTRTVLLSILNSRFAAVTWKLHTQNDFSHSQEAIS